MQSHRPTPHPADRAASEATTDPVGRSDASDAFDLLATMVELRQKLRRANRERGQVGLRLHLARLERDQARRELRDVRADAEEQARYARQLYYQLCEAMHVVDPTRTFGTFDDDYVWLIRELRRLRTKDLAEGPEEPRKWDPLTAPIDDMERR